MEIIRSLYKSRNQDYNFIFSNRNTDSNDDRKNEEQGDRLFN